jgi:tripartite-type tricarboxylate transporter receptor subunit TctC
VRFVGCRTMWLAGILLLSAGSAAAQGYPGKPVRLIVGFPPGSAADVVARVVAPRMSDMLGQQLVIDNRPGAGSNIAAELVVKAAPDGYTLFMGTIANTINSSLYKKLPFDFIRDLTPIILIASVPNILVVHPSLPAHSVQQLIALARSRPGQINFGSSGSGTAPHLAGEMFNSMAGIKMVHIPYKGSPQAVTDLLAGQVAVMFAPASTVLPHVRSGRLRALAVTGAQRSQQAPELATVAQSGMPGFESTIWFGILGPTHLPKEVVARLNAEAGKVLRIPAVGEQLSAQGIELLGGTPEQFSAHIAAETSKWAKAVRESGAKVE